MANQAFFLTPRQSTCTHEKQHEMSLAGPPPLKPTRQSSKVDTGRYDYMTHQFGTLMHEVPASPSMFLPEDWSDAGCLSSFDADSPRRISLKPRMKKRPSLLPRTRLARSICFPELEDADSPGASATGSGLFKTLKQRRSLSRESILLHQGKK